MKDPEFRREMEAHLGSLPEQDPVFHPEKYKPAITPALPNPLALAGGKTWPALASRFRATRVRINLQVGWSVVVTQRCRRVQRKQCEATAGF